MAATVGRCGDRTFRRCLATALDAKAVKRAPTVLNYGPPVWHHDARGGTEGGNSWCDARTWSFLRARHRFSRRGPRTSVHRGVILDAVGGILSVAQLVADSASTGRFDGITDGDRFV